MEQPENHPPSTEGAESLSSVETVLVWTRFIPDSAAIARTLELSGFRATVCPDDAAFCDGLAHCLLGIVTIETLNPTSAARVAERLSHQPPWSDVSVLLLTGRDVPLPAQAFLARLGNVTLLERPLHRSSLISIVQGAERARRKQVEVGELVRRNAELNVQLRRAMTETHHRVKNNLQLIAALVDMSAMANPDAAYHEEMRRLGSHVRVLAAIHDILTYDTKNDSEGRVLSVKAVLSRLFAMLGEAAPDRPIRYELEDVLLPTRHCTSLAMIANELVSNALKHTRRGVEVTFSVQDNCGLLTVLDDGAGFPPGFDPAQTGRVGLELVLNLSRHDLEGEVEFRNGGPGEGSGGCVRLSFPLPPASQY